MRSLFAVIRQLVLPAGSPTTAARIVIGPDLPADLVAFYAAGSYTTVGGIVMFNAGGDYVYLIEVVSNTGATVLAVGAKNSFGISEIYEIYPGSGSAFTEMLFGQFSGPPNNILIRNGVSLQVSGKNGSTKSQLLIGSDGLLTIGGAAATPGTLDIVTTGAFTIDGISAGRGLISFVAAQSDSAAIGAETAVLTDGTSRTFKSGRAFAAIYAARFAGSVANTVVPRLRKNTAAGTEILAWSHPLTTADQWFSGYNVFVNSTGSDVSFAPCFTLAATAGTATMRGATTIPRSIRIYDIGAATNYSNVPSV